MKPVRPNRSCPLAVPRTGRTSPQSNAKDNENPGQDHEPRGHELQVVLQCPILDPAIGSPAPDGLRDRVAVGRVTQEHTRAHETPQPYIAEAAQNDGLDECEVEQGAPHLGVQEGRVGGEGAAVACHDVEVRRREPQD